MISPDTQVIIELYGILVRRIKEDRGGSCDNCWLLDNEREHSEHCAVTEERPWHNVCLNWRKSVESEEMAANAGSPRRSDKATDIL